MCDDCEDNKVLASFHAYNDGELQRYAHATGYYLLINDLKNRLRGYLKHGHTFKVPDEALEDIQTYIYELCSEYHLPED